jgi:hypothetical protein
LGSFRPQAEFIVSIKGERTVEIGMLVEMVNRCIRSDGDGRGMLVYGYKICLAVRVQPTWPSVEQLSIKFFQLKMVLLIHMA